MEKPPDYNRQLKFIILILAVLLVGSFFFLLRNLETVRQQNENISDLTNISQSQKEQISRLQNITANLRQNLSMTEEQLKNETRTRQTYEREIINLTAVAKSDYYVIAVDQNNVGHLIPLEVVLKNGSGNLFLNVANVLIDEEFQSSAQTAVKVAREITGANLANKDTLINIESPPEAQGLLIQGGSAGAAMTLDAMAAMQGKTIRTDVLITGTINDDHSIGKIGAAREKALAAKESGAVLFLVPVGQKSDVGDIGIEVREVGTIEDAMLYTIQSP
ncbi:Lon protease [uncultured archaeon]|nr:Lon protease [uncultured archaeon]